MGLPSLGFQISLKESLKRYQKRLTLKNTQKTRVGSIGFESQRMWFHHLKWVLYIMGAIMPQVFGCDFGF